MALPLLRGGERDPRPPAFAMATAAGNGRRRGFGHEVRSGERGRRGASSRRQR